MTPLTSKRVLVVATHGVEHIDLPGVRDRLRERGARIVTASLDGEPIRALNQLDWTDDIPADARLGDVAANGFDALHLPGGIINPDLLRLQPGVLALVRAFHDAGKPIGALCHAPWLLISAGLVRGRGVAAWPSLKVDLENASAAYVDEPAVVDGGLVTGRNPDDIPAFCDAFAVAVAVAVAVAGAEARAA